MFEVAVVVVGAAHVVGVAEPFADLHRDEDRVGHLDLGPLPAERLRQRPQVHAVDVLHHDEVRRARATDVEDVNDVRVVEGRG